MNEPAPTRQQRDILDNLTKTLDIFHPAQLPYTEGVAPQPPAGRRKNPRALIVASGRVRPDPSQVRQKDRDPSSPRIQELARSIQLASNDSDPSSLHSSIRAHTPSPPVIAHQDSPRKRKMLPLPPAGFHSG